MTSNLKTYEEFVQINENYIDLYDRLMMDADDFVAIAKSKLGWAIAEQLEDILQGEGLGKQNFNALTKIKEFAADRGERWLEEALNQYLEVGDIEYLDEFDL